jgi:uncharacterized membrane protein
MKRLFLVLVGLASVGFLLLPILKTQAQDSSPDLSTDSTSTLDQSNQALTTSPLPARLLVENDYFLGKITAITHEDQAPAQDPSGPGLRQDATVRLTKGKEKGKDITINNYFSNSAEQHLKVGDTVVINKTSDQINGATYYIADKYRIPSAVVVGLLFLGLVIIFARTKGLSSILGLIFSMLVLVKFMIPHILAGQNPLVISLIGTVIIVLVSLYLAHGFNKRTSIALLATCLTLAIAVVLAILSVKFAHLTGTGTEESLFIQQTPAGTIDLRGLLLGGIIIGVIGVLDDVTTGQVAAVDEIRKANSQLNFHQLYKGGISVGQEHIASLVNTLVLAYAGASFPLFLLFALNTKTQPLWITINSELVMEEIIRTLVGSAALIFAVPIATFLAAFFLEGQPVTEAERHTSHGHHHH